jgi:predicted nucleic acid-binding protein
MAKMLEYVVLVALTDAIVARASSLDPAELRALDAIHLATAVDAGIADMLVYDHRLAAAARTHGLAVVSPGA